MTNMIDTLQRREFLKNAATLAAMAGGLINADIASAAPVAKPVPYEVNGRRFEGMIVYDDSATTKRPVIFMQPDWNGVSAETIALARTVAGTDYVVLMADMFGSGWGAKPRPRPELAAAVKTVHGDRAFTIACGGTAYRTMLAEANKLGLVDVAKVGAIGYCAGGGFVLEQARDGENFGAIVVFHVTNPNPSVPGTPTNIKGRVLAIHGSADPVTPKPMMDAFQEELTKAKVDWQVMMLGGAVHSFCLPTDNPRHCRMADTLMRNFFAETF